MRKKQPLQPGDLAEQKPKQAPKKASNQGGPQVKRMSRPGATPARVIDARAADANHQVVTVEGGKGSYRKTPCPDCPWRQDAVGVFPAEAFRLSASTAYDMSDRTFGCHSSGSKKPAICAGFLLNGAEHNLKVRLSRIKGQMDDDVTDGGHALHKSYAHMAVANGVDPEDPVLAPCR